MIPLSQLAAVVLAAGCSSRLPGENKLLKLFRGVPLLAHALETVCSAGLREVVLVVRPDDEAIADLGRAAGARPIVNCRPEGGMGPSIAAGIRELTADVSGVFVLPGDMPLIENRDLAALAAALPGDDPLTICAPVFAGRRGHPVLFARGHFDALARLSGDAGGRAVIAAHHRHLVEVPATSDHVLVDFDTAADFSSGEDRRS